LGADLVMESLTKMIGGHSDVTLGVVAGQKRDAESLLPQMAQVMSIWGFSGSPFDCWLAERGLDSLPLRMRTASANALALADWLLRLSVGFEDLGRIQEEMARGLEKL